MQVEDRNRIWFKLGLRHRYIFGITPALFPIEGYSVFSFLNNTSPFSLIIVRGDFLASFFTASIRVLKQAIKEWVGKRPRLNNMIKAPQQKLAVLNINWVAVTIPILLSWPVLWRIGLLSSNRFEVCPISSTHTPRWKHPSGIQEANKKL